MWLRQNGLCIPLKNATHVMPKWHMYFMSLENCDLIGFLLDISLVVLILGPVLILCLILVGLRSC